MSRTKGEDVPGTAGGENLAGILDDSDGLTQFIDDLFEKDPGGSSRVFRGTRVPADAVFQTLADGLSLDEVLGDYPALRRADVVAVMERVSAWLDGRGRN